MSELNVLCCITHGDACMTEIPAADAPESVLAKACQALCCVSSKLCDPTVIPLEVFLKRTLPRLEKSDGYNLGQLTMMYIGCDGTRCDEATTISMAARFNHEITRLQR